VNNQCSVAAHRRNADDAHGVVGARRRSRRSPKKDRHGLEVDVQASTPTKYLIPKHTALVLARTLLDWNVTADHPQHIRGASAQGLRAGGADRTTAQ
jgi:hypothetical protein